MQPNVRQDKILDIFYDFFSKKNLSCALLVAARVGSVNSGGPMIAHTKKLVFSCAETGNVVFKKTIPSRIPLSVIRAMVYG